METLDIFEAIKFPLVPILELNPNIRNLYIPAYFLIKNAESMKSSDVALDDLAIFLGRDSVQLASVFNLLNELYERGRFKRLLLNFGGYEFNSDVIGQFYSLNRMIVGLTLNRLDEGLKLFPALDNLEELNLVDNKGTNNMNVLASSLKNLKRIQVENSSECLLPFIRQTKQ